jgi:hypothetical protein
VIARAAMKLHMNGKFVKAFTNIIHKQHPPALCTISNHHDSSWGFLLR